MHAEQHNFLSCMVVFVYCRLPDPNSVEGRPQPPKCVALVVDEQASAVSAAERGYLQKADATAFVVRYWHVQMSGEEKDPNVNMKVTLKESVVNGSKVTYPLLVNTRAVKANEALIYFCPSTKKTMQAPTKNECKARLGTSAPIGNTNAKGTHKSKGKGKGRG